MCTSSNSSCTSARDLPLTASVSSDADATEIAQPLPSNFASRDALAVEIHVHRQPVAAQRIVAVGVRVGRIEPAEVPRMAVVVDDDVAIEVFQIHAAQPAPCARCAERRDQRGRSPRTCCRSDSEARAVAGTSKKSITGIAQ